MSDIALYDKRSGNYPAISRQRLDINPIRKLAFPNLPQHSFQTLPADVLLSVIEHLDVEEVTALSGTCRSLREFSRFRTVWLRLAAKMLDICHPLPVHGFQRLWELDTSQLSSVVKRGKHIHRYLNSPDPHLADQPKIIQAPESEDIVWLSPITSKYTLCCTKSGKVMCWNVSDTECVAEWQSGEEWEIWKCRVEFDERIVYFAMAKREPDGNHGETDCQLMALTFPAEENGALPSPPVFSKLSVFCFPGHVISVYLLDPSRRLLSAYIWLEEAQRLGLYVLLDWAKPCYTFIDTGIPCEARQDPPREWSCIGYDPANVVIHGEEKEKALQYFYPISLLDSLKSPDCPPKPLHLIPPSRTVELPFLHNHPDYEAYVSHSAHFVRQWWPTLPNAENIRKQSSTIILLSYRVPEEGEGGEDRDTHEYPPGTHLFTIAQHYFSIPLQADQLRWWYLSEPFEIVCFPHLPPGAVLDGDEIIMPAQPNNPNNNAAAANDTGAEPQAQQDVAGEEEADQIHVIPLIAVDFGCAVWLEYINAGSDEKRLRFVSFPSVDVDRSAPDFKSVSGRGDVRTLERPPDLDLSSVSHIGIDQAQGAVILGLINGQVYIMRYR